MVFELDTSGHYTVLHNFMGSDGAFPYYDLGVIRDPAGNLYGTTNGGGAGSFGVVYKLDAAGNYAVLHNFAGALTGASPSSGVIRDATGNLYGTAYFGGLIGAGVVYELSAAGKYAVLYSFTGGADGSGPSSGVIRDAAGNLYGTTLYGGAANAGVVYKLDPSGQQTVLYSFTGGADGRSPSSGVIRDDAGNLYGTTWYGGTANAGVLYKLDTAGHETVLHNFTCGRDGCNTAASSTAISLMHDSAGNLYGTTCCGGAYHAGVLYKLNATDKYTVLHSFTGGGDGGDPDGGLALGSGGDLYGATAQGGTGNAGVVYKLGATGHYSVLYSFTGAGDGGDPQAGVILTPDGNLFGTTFGGGKLGSGVVFMLTAR